MFAAAPRCGGGTKNLVDAKDPELTRLKGIVERAEPLVLFPGLALWVLELFY